MLRLSLFSRHSPLLYSPQRPPSYFVAPASSRLCLGVRRLDAALSALCRGGACPPPPPPLTPKPSFRAEQAGFLFPGFSFQNIGPSPPPPHSLLLPPPPLFPLFFFPPPPPPPLISPRPPAPLSCAAAPPPPLLGRGGAAPPFPRLWGGGGSPRPPLAHHLKLSFRAQ